MNLCPLKMFFEAVAAVALLKRRIPARWFGTARRSGVVRRALALNCRDAAILV